MPDEKKEKTPKKLVPVKSGDRVKLENGKTAVIEKVDGKAITARIYEKGWERIEEKGKKPRITGDRKKKGWAESAPLAHKLIASVIPKPKQHRRGIGIRL